MAASRVTSGRLSVCAAATTSASIGSREPQLVGQDDLPGREVERLEGGIAEEIVQEGAEAAAQVDAAPPRQQAALPDHGRRPRRARGVPLRAP